MRSNMMNSVYIQRLITAVLLTGVFTLHSNAAELPQYAAEKHMGVATCANSSCHSVTQLEEPSNVLQNEYRTWLFHDRHSKAYTTLLSDESKRIAVKLGIENAATADVCLDCHSDNVPEDKRGPEFYLTDGVGCEACHGGSEKWIGRHILTPYSAERNQVDGMYPSSDLAARTKLCASCHVGNEKKLATHTIMGAGHPRLGFELDTFTIRQPEHYVVDDDYIARKNLDNPVLRLLVGSAVQAQAVANNLSGALIDHPQGHPEVSLYDCYSCHHSLSDLKWQQRPSTAGLKPGAIRLNDSSFILLAGLIGALDGDLQREMLSGIKRLHSASTASVKDLQTAAKSLNSLAIQSQRLFENSSVNDAQKSQMIEALMRQGANGEYRDYVSAEQAVMAMDALSYSLPSDPALTKVINEAYQTTADDEAYQSNRFKKDLQEYLKQNTK
jgi:hypothetical protein